MFALYPDMNPLTKKWYPENWLRDKKLKILKRLGMTEEQLKADL